MMAVYSPYDNVRAQGYPAMFGSTGLWDSQVQYYEPTKWVARLRAHKTDRNPLVFRVNMEQATAANRADSVVIRTRPKCSLSCSTG